MEKGMNSLSARRFLGTGAALALMIAVLLWPALWNGFPIVFPDTGGYLARPFDGTLAMGRSALYGAFLAIGIPLQFWPNVAAQAALTVWMLVVTMRAHDLVPRPAYLGAAILGLSAFTGLPWYVSQLMPDILAPCAILALYLLAFRAAFLRRAEIAGLSAVVAIAAACHMAILGLGLCLVAILVPWRLLGAPRPQLLAPAAALAIGLVLAPLSNFVFAQKFAFTPGGMNFIFGRLVQDGIVRAYLDMRCPDEKLRLCQHRDQIVGLSADDWLWDEPSPFYELGGIEGFGSEARQIVIGSLIAFPGRHLVTALNAALSQFLQTETGEGLISWNPHTQWIFSLHAPAALASYEGAKQARQQFNFSALNAIQVPFAFACLIAMPLVLLMRRRLRVTKAAAALLAFAILALLFNAAICGILSNPHDRYQNRLIWIAPLGLAIALATRTPPPKPR